MSRSVKAFSLCIIIVTSAWFVYELTLRQGIKWHFLTAGAVNFLAAIIVNRQFTYRSYNYLGIFHVMLAILLFGYGYFFL
ncbi:hypothetical protein [Nonlabens spongiae]|uniref:hypothetical protein n=1 Tax=Nonlabens spongiae TaxID=331648 RepID=UPI0012F507FF|nr:hypothetical protein [Nonlabens spongiae]